MVVPTYPLKYPEGGSHALQVCQHHHQVYIRLMWSRPLIFVGLSVVRDSRNTLLATAPADSAETFTA